MAANVKPCNSNNPVATFEFSPICARCLSTTEMTTPTKFSFQRTTISFWMDRYVFLNLSLTWDN